MKKDKGEPKRKWYADIAFTPEPLKSFDNRACRFKQEYQLPKDVLEADYSINEAASTVCKEINK